MWVSGLTARLPRNRGAGRDGRLRVWIVVGVESLSEAGAERAVVDGAADLTQQVGAASRPAHLLRFVHPAVHQDVGRTLGQRRADPQSSPVPLGVVDQPVGLAGETVIQRPQCGPQLSRWRDGPSAVALTPQVTHDRANTIDADRGVLSALVPASIAGPMKDEIFRWLPTHSRLLRCTEGSGTYGSRRRLADWFGSGNGGSCATRRRRDRIRQPIVGT